MAWFRRRAWRGLAAIGSARRALQLRHLALERVHARAKGGAERLRGSQRSPADRRPHSVVQRRRFGHLVPQLIARPQGRPKLARGRRGLRGKGKVVSPQGFVRIHLRMQSHLQELPLLALDGQKVLGIPFEAAARQFGAAMHRGIGTAVSIHRAAPSLGRQLHVLQLHAELASRRALLAVRSFPRKPFQSRFLVADNGVL